MHPDVEEFIVTLVEIEQILYEQGQSFWLKKIRRSKQLAEMSDNYSIVVFLGCFGGMGSLRDLVFDAPITVNSEFQFKLTRAHQIALNL